MKRPKRRHALSTRTMAAGGASESGCLDLVQAGSFQEAVPVCTKAVGLDPDNQKLKDALEKAKAGLAVTRITQKAVEILGPPGYSRKLLVEKWMRDAKINDIYEGTQQINQLIVARRILDYPSSMLR